MLPKGTITRVLDWFMSEPSLEADRKRATEEFVLDDFGQDMTRPLGCEEEMVCEWIAFDFRMKTGRGVMREYLRANWERHTKEEISLYEELQASNVLGVFEVGRVKPGEWMEMASLVDGESRRVFERSGSSQAAAGDYLLARIGQVGGGRWEIVGGIVMPLAQDAAEALVRYMRMTLQDWNVRNVRHALLESLPRAPYFNALKMKTDTVPSAEILLRMHDRARDRLAAALKRAGMGSVATPVELESYIGTPGGDQNLVMILNERFLRKNSPGVIYRMNDSIRCLQTFANHAVRKEPKGSFNLLMNGMVGTRENEPRRKRMRFDAICESLFAAYDAVESYRGDGMAEAPDDLCRVALYALDWCAMECPRLIEAEGDAGRLASVALYMADLFYTATSDRNDHSLNLDGLAKLGRFRTVDDLRRLGDNAIEAVCNGLRDSSVFAVDPARAPDGWRERLDAFVQVAKDAGATSLPAFRSAH